MFTRHNEIRWLFDEVITKFQKEGNTRFRDKQIFARVLGDTWEMRDAFYEFVHDVSTCPPKVIQWC